MTYVKRYSYRNHCYEKPEELPKNWHTPLVADSMDEIINCACCGKEIRYGDGYSSIDICGMSGCLGYSICEECYKKELAELFEEICGRIGGEEHEHRIYR